jgi:hypothetical protein
MDNILNEIRAEREYQKNKWGDEVDVTVNTPNDFVSYIAHHSTRWFDGGFTPYTSDVVDTYRKQMIKTATLAVAAVEALDKQRETNGQAFFEDVRE